MFAGHVGAALAIGRFERRVNVGWLAFAAMLLDFVLWLLVLLGLEQVTITPDFSATHQPQFNFPYSHGLLAGVIWASAAGAVALAVRPGLKAGAACVAAAVFSHWLLDALVHAPELPLAGGASVKVGLGLWQSMPLALSVETAIAVAGLCAFLAGAGLSRSKAAGLVALMLAVIAFTVMGMTVAPPPPSVAAMAVSSLVTIVAVSALVAWLGRPPRSG